MGHERRSPEEQAPGMPGWGEGHHGSRPKSEQELGERGSFGRTQRITPRSDDDIWDDVGRALAECSDLDASEIEVFIENGTVQLDGIVGRPYERRLAASLIEDIPGVRSVKNHLEPRDPI
jgi:osmotically-inducible protein OsmY